MQNETVVPVFTTNKNVAVEDKMNGTSGSIDFYYFPPSPPCRSVMLLAKALGIEMDMKLTNLMSQEHISPEFIKMNPQHVIPTINDKGFILWESRAIMQYLVDQYGKDDTLNPKEPKKAALVNQRLYFDACTLFPRLLEYFRPVVFQKQPPDPEKAEKFEEAMGWLDGFLDNQVWSAGEYMTVADFALMSTTETARAVQFDISKFPNVDSWYNRTKKAMADYDYEEINEKGAGIIGDMFKNNVGDL